MDKMLAELEQKRSALTERSARGAAWEHFTKAAVQEFEPLARHLRRKLLTFPMTASRRKQLEELNFQQPVIASGLLLQWFDIGFLEWPGNAATQARRIPDSDLPFITKMMQKRHILTHTGGIVDEQYIALSGDTGVQLGERIRVRSNEAKRFVEHVGMMGMNLLDNVEYAFGEG